MIDIIGIGGGDLVLANSLVPKATNLLQVQIGSLEYASDFGIDLEFFLDPDFQFQNESFKSYLIQRLSENHVNVNQVTDLLQQFFLKWTFVVGDAGSNGGFIK